MPNIFVYHWYSKDEETEEGDLQNIIYAFGIDETNKNVCIRIDDFTPYCYIELPSNELWTDTKIKTLKNRIRDMKVKKETKYESAWLPLDTRISKIEFMKKKRLFYNHKKIINNKFADRKFPYLYISFNDDSVRRSLEWPLNKIKIQGNTMDFKVHENNASTILQLTCRRGIKTAGWINFKGELVKEKQSHCDLEYIVKCRDLHNIESISNILCI
jgi:DNA polymerase elongation subunit (family B)